MASVVAAITSRKKQDESTEKFTASSYIHPSGPVRVPGFRARIGVLPIPGIHKKRDPP